MRPQALDGSSNDEPRAKYTAISAISGSYILTLTLSGWNAVSLLFGVGLAALMAYLATRREPPSPAAL